MFCIDVPVIFTFNQTFCLQSPCWLENGLFVVKSSNLMIFEEDKIKKAFVLQTILSVGSQFNRLELIIEKL